MNTSEHRKTVYFAGELFSLKHLVGNAALAESLHRESAGKYRCVLPQDLEQRETTPQAIRDQDISSLLACDVGLFNFDGDEIDSGTVVEFMIAKFADIPAVIVRSDFRGGGDNGVLPWNLMLSNYPRTEVVLLDAIAEYQRQLSSDEAHAGRSVTASLRAYDETARKILAAFEKVENQQSLLPPELREPVYQWLRLMPGLEFSKKLPPHEMRKLLERKVAMRMFG
ncbi:MAG: nucleoside 2-deoxyribosyltransferase [Bdellovibrionota bacterium]